MTNKVTETTKEKASRSGYMESLRRLALALLGILCVAIGGLGVILPGLPTTIFLLAACYLFTRSSPRLEQVLVRNRFFGAFHRYLDGSVEMSWGSKLVALLVMWSFITFSTITLWKNPYVSIYVALAVPTAGLIGTYFILTFGKKSRNKQESD